MTEQKWQENLKNEQQLCNNIITDWPAYNKIPIYRKTKSLHHSMDIKCLLSLPQKRHHIIFHISICWCNSPSYQIGPKSKETFLNPLCCPQKCPEIPPFTSLAALWCPTEHPLNPWINILTKKEECVNDGILQDIIIYFIFVRLPLWKRSMPQKAYG